MKNLFITLGITLATAMLCVAVMQTSGSADMDKLRRRFKEANSNIFSYTLTSDIQSEDVNANAVEYVDTSQGYYCSYYKFVTDENNIDADYQNYIFAKDDIKTDAVKDVDGEWTIKTTAGNSEPIVPLSTALDRPEALDSGTKFNSSINKNKTTESEYVVDTSVESSDYKVTYQFTIDGTNYLIKHVTINEYHNNSEEPATHVEQDYTDYNSTEVPIDDTLKSRFNKVEDLLTTNSPYFIEDEE